MNRFAETSTQIAGRVVIDKKTFYEDFADQSDDVEATEPRAPDAQNGLSRNLLLPYEKKQR